MHQTLAFVISIIVHGLIYLILDQSSPQELKSTNPTSIQLKIVKVPQSTPNKTLSTNQALHQHYTHSLQPNAFSTSANFTPHKIPNQNPLLVGLDHDYYPDSPAFRFLINTANELNEKFGSKITKINLKLNPLPKLPEASGYKGITTGAEDFSMAKYAFERGAHQTAIFHSDRLIKNGHTQKNWQPALLASLLAARIYEKQNQTKAERSYLLKARIFCRRLLGVGNGFGEMAEWFGGLFRDAKKPLLPQNESINNIYYAADNGAYDRAMVLLNQKLAH